MYKYTFFFKLHLLKYITVTNKTYAKKEKQNKAKNKNKNYEIKIKHPKKSKIIAF